MAELPDASAQPPLFSRLVAAGCHCRDAIEGRDTYKLKEERERKVKAMINCKKWKELEAA